MKGLLGIKKGERSFFDVDGKKLNVTIFEIPNNTVTKINTEKSDGYSALQLSICEKKLSRATKSEINHFKKAKTSPKMHVKEIRDFKIEKNLNLGDTISVKDVFENGDLVDLTAKSKGKGFSGSIKRHNFSLGPAAHGSGHHRAPGSTGSVNANRTFKAMKMPGRAGNVQRTVQNQRIVEIDSEGKFIIIEGSCPGANNSLVIIKQAVKKPNVKKPAKLHVETANKESLEKIAEQAKMEHDKKEAIKQAEIAKEEAKAKAAMQKHEKQNVKAQEPEVKTDSNKESK